MDHLGHKINLSISIIIIVTFFDFLNYSNRSMYDCVCGALHVLEIEKDILRWLLSLVHMKHENIYQAYLLNIFYHIYQTKKIKKKHYVSFMISITLKISKKLKRTLKKFKNRYTIYHAQFNNILKKLNLPVH